MAQRKELEIEITPTGEVKVTVKCVPGQACVEETKFLEEALGNDIKDRQLTSDYYQTGVTSSTGVTSRH
jgi:DUF2997 family protein